MMTEKTETPMKNQRGYTILEVLIAMVVLMISFLAIIAAQTSTLQGYLSSRDNAAASELGRRAVELIRVESEQWRGGSADSGSISKSYVAADAPVDVATTITKIHDQPWTWQLLTDPDPVNISFGRASADSTGNFVGGRFCIFVRGGYLGTDKQQFSYTNSGGTSLTGSAAMQVQVAVVYPAANGDLRSCTTVDTANLDEASDAYLGESLELQGLRSNYFGTIIIRRDYI